MDKGLKELFKDAPTQGDLLAYMTEEGKKDFIFGGCCYDVETGEGRRVFTLRAARKCSLEEIEAILHYMTIADKIDILENEKDAISFYNLFKAMKEKLPPPTEEEKAETARAWERFTKKHPEFFGDPEEGEA